MVLSCYPCVIRYSQVALFDPLRKRVDILAIKCICWGRIQWSIRINRPKNNLIYGFRERKLSHIIWQSAAYGICMNNVKIDYSASLTDFYGSIFDEKFANLEQSAATKFCVWLPRLSYSVLKNLKFLLADSNLQPVMRIYTSHLVSDFKKKIMDIL